MRLFFALELPTEVRAALGGLRQTASKEYRWVDPALLHVTLAFLGQQPPERLTLLEQVGSAAAADAQAGLLELGRAGSFGSRHEPRVLWIGLDGDVPALLALQTRLATGLRRAGLALEERPFSAHITLARRRPGARSDVPPDWPPAHTPTKSAFAMDHLTLVESRLSPRGATYFPLLEFPFGGSV
ncbi:MAG: RNA 2',3'-cyclic phosphodiesterase [Chloroflexota bacterium]